jgi:dephospho-CoA kinase
VKKFGLTGGIGMGKSACAQLLLRRAVHVLDTDDLARDLVQPGQPALDEIISTFGASCLDAAGQLRRDALANLVFNDSNARQKLEAILHPRIAAAWAVQLNQWQSEGVSRAVVVIPLLFETAAEAQFDSVVCVACSTETQCSRLTGRGWSEKEIARRAAAQLPIEQKIARAHQVIWTEGSMEAHAEQVARVFGLC